MSGPLLAVTVVASTPTGPLSLNEFPYELAADTFGQLAVTHKKQEATNPFIEGSYTINALRENFVQALAIYVRGATHAAFQKSLRDLTAVFDQSTFEVRRDIEGVIETWQCFASDYTISLQREFLHARMARLDVQLVAHPGARASANQYSVL